MVDVRTRRCAHASCVRHTSWGLLTNGAATACSRHRSHLSGGLVINFKAICKVSGCGRESRWGLAGKQPTHCHDHGPLDDALVCIVGAASVKTKRLSPSYHAVRGPSFHVKAECMF
ncbi:unnamed protein product [Laminaria digitata]